MEANLINLEETMTADQDHNYLINEDNDNIDDDENPLNAEVLSLRSDLREKENQIIQLVEENSKLKEEGKTKDELNDALTASNNSLEDVLGITKSKVKALEETKSKYEKKLKTYSTTIKEMNLELQQNKAPKDVDNKDVDSEKKFQAVSEKLHKENKSINEKLAKATKASN